VRRRAGSPPCIRCSASSLLWTAADLLHARYTPSALPPKLVGVARLPHQAAFVAALDALESALAAAPGPLFGGTQLNAVDAALAPKLYHALTATKHFKVGAGAGTECCCMPHGLRLQPTAFPGASVIRLVSHLAFSCSGAICSFPA
jgi:hypothetical protein